MKMNETDKGEVHVAICPSGSQFFWCVVDAATEDVIASGRKPTLEEAEEQIWAQSAINRKGKKTIQLDEEFAKRIRRELWKSDCRPIGESLYTYRHTGDGSFKSVAHPIVRQTERYNYVKVGGFVHRIDRRLLDRDGTFHVPNSFFSFHKVPFDEWDSPEKVKYLESQREGRRLRERGLTAFSEQEREEAVLHLSRFGRTINDESLLEMCIFYRLIDPFLETKA